MYCDCLQLMLSLLFLASDPIADASSILRCYRQPLKSRELLADYHNYMHGFVQLVGRS